MVGIRAAWHKRRYSMIQSSSGAWSSGRVQAILEAEMTAHLGRRATSGPQSALGIATAPSPAPCIRAWAPLELRVPQDRDGTFSTDLFGRYQRNEQALVLALLEMYLQGVSTRKVAAITEQLCGTSFSKSQVSALAGRLDTELAAWRERPLAASYPYLRWMPATSTSASMAKWSARAS